MDPDTFRSDLGMEPADVYLRRRIAVLTGVLVVVAVVAWACTRGPDKGEHAAVTVTPSGSLVVTLPSGAPKSDAPGAQASAAPSASPTPKPSRTRRPRDPCDAKDLVIALQSGQEVYGKDATPTFLLTVVNTARTECTVDVGPRALEMRVTSSGERIWSTADCVAGPGVERQTLERGVPYIRIIKWDRHRSGTDCKSKRPRATAGTYVATAYAGELKSSRVVFRLR